MEQSESLFELQIDHQGSSFLREIAKWSKFLSIVGFVVMGLVLLFLIFAGSAMSSAFSAYGSNSSGSTAGMIVVIAVFFIYFFPCLYLYKFASKMLVALRNNDQETLNLSFENLKSCFKFMGILTIIVLALYALVFIVSLLALTRL